MSSHVLIAYGTKYGATAEIGREIGNVIRENGHSVDVKQANEVRTIDPYDAVIIGSALYMGMWIKDAKKFAVKNQALLADKKVWVFVSGPTGGDDPVKEMEGWFFPPKLAKVFDQIRPVEVTAFGGKVDEDKLSGFEKFILKKVNAPTGDYRDWTIIKKWADKIAKAL